jgi:hypothetical protein
VEDRLSDIGEDLSLMDECKSTRCILLLEESVYNFGMRVNPLYQRIEMSQLRSLHIRG